MKVGEEVTGRRRALHIASERAALLVAAPGLVWASYQTPVPLARWGLRLLAAATVFVDGALLSQWRRGPSSAQLFADALQRRRR